MLYDLLTALRSIRRHPVFTAMAVVTLGLGIGATVTVLSVAEAVLLRPLPYPKARELVDISHATKENARLTICRLDMGELRAQTDVFQDVGGRFISPSDIVFEVGTGPPAHAAVLPVSHNYLSILGIEPFLGRTFTWEDAEPVAESEEEEEDAVPPTPGLVVTYGFWERALGANPNLSDINFRIQGRSFRILGVLPRSFRLLHERPHRWIRGTNIDFFVVVNEEYFRYNPEYRGRNILALARTQPGISPVGAQAAMDVLSARLRAEVPQYDEEQLRVQVSPLREDLTATTGPVLLVLSGGVLFLMLLVGANLANLLLVRGRIRAGEDAVRATVGCGKGQLLRQRFAECVLLVALGSVLGAFLAWAAVHVVRALAPANIPLMDRVGINGPVLLMALTTAFLLVLLSSLIPILQASRLDLVATLKSDTPGTGRQGGQKVMNTLVVVELALSMVLLSGAAVMLRTLAEMNRTDMGFEADPILTFRLWVSAEEYGNLEAYTALLMEVDEKIEAIPGVEALARTSMPPLSGTVWNRVYGWDQESLDLGTERADIIVSTEDYFKVMGTRLKAGRFFTPQEMTDSSRSIIVDEKLAGIAWPGQDPIGKHVVFREGELDGEVVGVVEPMLMRDFGLESYEAIHYPPGRFWAGRAGIFVVRAGIDPAQLAEPIRQVLRSIHPSLLPYNLVELSDRVNTSLAPTQFVVFMMGSFAGISFLVAITGLFGVIAYAVRTRTAEMGIRMALGADRDRIFSLVLRRGAFLTGSGIAAGILGALILGRFIESLVFGVSPTDPTLLVVAALVLGGVSFLACCAPAQWACRLDPAQVLRTE